MNQNILILTAASLGFVHTVLGPDHYIPFIALSKARNWSLSKSLAITVLCGTGHVLGSIVLGLIGVFSGIALEKLKLVEAVRGSVAAYLLIAFGLIYMLYGIRRAFKNQPHNHKHVHADGTIHNHIHTHKRDHTHVHSEKRKITPWVLFIIFVFGPCEVLIPVLMYPAAQNDTGLLIAATTVFALVTIATMSLIVLSALAGANFFRFRKVEKFSHALAGLLILLCGVGVQFLGI